MTPRIIAANLGVRLKSFYRERSAMFFTFAFPVILVLVFGTIFTKPEHLNFDLPVQDNSRSAASARLLEALATGDAFTVTPVPVAVDATQYAKEHKLNLLLVIPKDFEALQRQRVAGPRRRRPGAAHLCVRPELDVGGHQDPAPGHDRGRGQPEGDGQPARRSSSSPRRSCPNATASSSSSSPASSRWRS